ncbi:MAG: Fe-S protein assembly co-chaperone HscB [Betaproteobacteria bacterium]|nr:Fe-S protein assembly co-chaperone HscB [Betaproteobacteria bacterium]
MTPEFSRNHFELLGLPVSFTVDAAALDDAYRELQGRVHPDRFASAGEAERRVAMQWATRANEAYRTLRNPIDRARYLLGLKGYDTGEESNTAMPPDFLMQQMEWRESVEEGRARRDAAALEALRREIEASRAEMHALLARALGGERNYDAGCSLVRKLRFLDKIEAEIDDAVETILEGATTPRPARSAKGSA